MVGEVAQGGPFNEKQIQERPHVCSAALSTKPHCLKSHKEKEWPSLLCLMASGEKDQDELEARTAASCVLQPGVLFYKQQPGSNSSKHTEVPQSGSYSQRNRPALWFLTDHADSGEAMEKGLKGAMSHTASRLNLSRHSRWPRGPLCSTLHEAHLSGPTVWQTAARPAPPQPKQTPCPTWDSLLLIQYPSCCGFLEHSLLGIPVRAV